MRGKSKRVGLPFGPTRSTRILFLRPITPPQPISLSVRRKQFVQDAVVVCLHPIVEIEVEQIV